MPEAKRAAHFRTVALLRFPDGREIIAEGRIDGFIADRPRGTEGMGYDPVFIAGDIDGRTFAEMGIEEKSRISHRASAFLELRRLLTV